MPKTHYVGASLLNTDGVIRSVQAIPNLDDPYIDVTIFENGVGKTYHISPKAAFNFAHTLLAMAHELEVENA